MRFRQKGEGGVERLARVSVWHCRESPVSDYPIWRLKTKSPLHNPRNPRRHRMKHPDEGHGWRGMTARITVSISLPYSSSKAFSCKHPRKRTNILRSKRLVCALSSNPVDLEPYPFLYIINRLSEPPKLFHIFPADQSRVFFHFVERPFQQLFRLLDVLICCN
jgi:hypothetical protein